MSRRQMRLAAASATPYGGSPYGWLEPGVVPANYTDVHVLVHCAQAAERGKFEFLFFGDFLAQIQRSEADAPNQNLEPTIVATAIALATERIGLVAAVVPHSRSHNTARVLKSPGGMVRSGCRGRFLDIPGVVPERWMPLSMESFRTCSTAVRSAPSTKARPPRETSSSGTSTACTGARGLPSNGLPAQPIPRAQATARTAQSHARKEDMMARQMLIGMHLGNGYGNLPGAWRAPGVDPTSYTSFDAKVRHAQAAERGKLQFLFLPDGPTHVGDIANEPPNFNLDVMVTLAAVARETSQIGLVATGSTTFNEPFNLARQFKALDVLSHGRTGWNAVTSSGEDVAANYGQRIQSSPERYGRAHETVQLVQALWSSWGENAWVHDKTTGRFAHADQVAPINLGGEFVASRGPLYIPPSEQGQPVIFHAGGSPNAHEFAGRWASAVIGAAFTIDDARAQRAAFRDAAARAGRDPDEIKFFAGLMTTITPDRREGLDRRVSLSGRTFPQRASYLGQMLGLHIHPAQLDEPLSPEQLSAARPSPGDPRSVHALKIAREGWTVRDVLAHGVIDYHPVIVGPATEAADHMQEWFEADAVDGFWVSPDIYDGGVDAFVDGVVPILQDRGLFHRDYDGATLRGHLGGPAQYGVDPRVTQ